MRTGAWAAPHSVCCLKSRTPFTPKHARPFVRSRFNPRTTGGECNVPYTYRFYTPATPRLDPRKSYYSFDVRRGLQRRVGFGPGFRTAVLG